MKAAGACWSPIPVALGLQPHGQIWEACMRPSLCALGATVLKCHEGLCAVGVPDPCRLGSFPMEWHI